MGRISVLHHCIWRESLKDFQELKAGWNGLRVRPCRSLRSSQAWKQSRRTLERKTPRQLHGLSFVLQAWKMSLLGTWSIMVNSNFRDFLIFEAEFPVIFWIHMGFPLSTFPTGGSRGSCAQLQVLCSPASAWRVGHASHGCCTRCRLGWCPGFPGHGRSIMVHHGPSSKAFSLRDAVENALFLSGRDIWMVRFDQAKSGMVVRGPKRFKNWSEHLAVSRRNDTMRCGTNKSICILWDLVGSQWIQKIRPNNFQSPNTPKIPLAVYTIYRDIDLANYKNLTWRISWFSWQISSTPWSVGQDLITPFLQVGGLGGLVVSPWLDST